MSYTADEITEAVQRLVKGSLSFPRDRLGPRDVNSPYEEMIELVHSILLYEQDSVFYLINLAKKTAASISAAELATIDDLLDAIDDLLKPSVPVNDVSGLREAASALSSMETALARKGVIGGKEYNRYTSALGRVQEQLGRTVKLTHVPRNNVQQVTEVVRPAPEAKIDVRNHFDDLKEVHSNLLSAIDQLQDAYGEFRSADLASSVASYQLTRASSVLREVSDELEPLTAKERIPKARSALLNILANKSVVKAVASRIDPGAAKIIQEASPSPTYRLSATGTGVTPSITGAISAPWPLEGGVDDELKFSLNGTALSAIDLLPTGDSFIPGVGTVQLTGSNKGPFPVHADLGVPYSLLTKEIPTGNTYATLGKTLYMIVDGTTFSIDFIGNRTAAQVATLLNASMSGYITATANSGGGNDWVEIEWDNTTDPPVLYTQRYMEVATGINDATDLGPWRVNTSIPTAGTVTRGWDGNDVLKIQPNDLSSSVSVNLTNGAWPTYLRTAAQVASNIDSAGGTHFDGDTDTDRVVVRTKSAWKGEGAALKIVTDGMSGGRPTVSLSAAMTLGFAPNQDIRGADVPSHVVVNILNNDPGFRGEALASANRTELLHSNRVTSTAPSTLSMVLSDLTVNPTIGWTLPKLKLSVDGGDNSGFYGVVSATWVPATKTLNIVVDRGLRNVNPALLQNASIYEELLTIRSRDSSTGAEIDVDETALRSAHVILGLPTSQQISTVGQVLIERNDPITGWIPADLMISRIRSGDKLLDGLGAEVAVVTDVSQVTSGIVGVGAVASNLSLSAFSIESAAYLAYIQFVTDLGVWRTTVFPPFDDETLRDIDEMLSPLLLLEYPTPARVNAAYSLVESLRNKIVDLQTVFSNFIVLSINKVDNALNSMQERGFNRSRDLLLTGRFKDFFKTTVKTSSYSRAMMNAASETAIEDMNEPTKRLEEYDVDIDRIRTEYVEDDVDPKWDFSDMETEFSPQAVDYWPSWEDGSDGNG